VVPIKISELKNRLSHYLGLVRRGEAVLVSDRDEVIARIEPAGGRDRSDDSAEWLASLERRGILRRASRRLPRDWIARAPEVKADLVDAVIRERAEGR